MDVEDLHERMEEEEQIMIMIDGLEDNQDDPDLLDLLGSEPQVAKKGSLNYDYLPLTPSISALAIEEYEEVELKTSNRSTSTCPDSQVVVRKCTCTKTRCQKNYCECFKLGEVCGPECECKDCGNKEKLFLSKPIVIKIKCKCLKSHCLKKYCECHSSGQKCGADCRCLQCQNLELNGQMEEESSKNYFDHHLFFNI